MDIIASHQQGLFEQIEGEALALAGSPRDSAQRAVVYHHLADSLGLANVHALLAARGSLAIEEALAAMRRAVARRAWRHRTAWRGALEERVARFGAALRELDRTRCAAALLAYRLVATPGLASHAQARLLPELLTAYCACQAARGDATAAERLALFAAQQRWSEQLIGDGIEQAIVALAWPLGARPVRTAIAALRIPLTAYQRSERRGAALIERDLRRSKALPAAFAANPAQAFYALQRRMAELRRRGADISDLSPDEAVRLAA